MTEPKPITQYSVTIGCHNCNHIGEIVTIGGMDVLVINGIAFTTIHGVCQTCGRDVHFNSRDKQLARLVRCTVEELNTK